jgi:hypothetical protein
LGEINGKKIKFDKENKIIIAMYTVIGESGAILAKI